MILGIDASNIRGGGGVTHLVELLRAANPLVSEFTQVIVWGGTQTLGRIEDRPWLIKSHQPILDRNLVYRSVWQRFKLSELVRQAGCDVLFVPGGSYTGNFHPMVTMSRNMLPFEWRELLRFGWSWMTLKLAILRLIQARAFQRADGLIFLTQYAHDAVMQLIKPVRGKVAVIPHGIDKRFICPPREQMTMDFYSWDRPFHVLYVSVVDVYKHQWHVAEAVAQLRAGGLPVTLELVGPAYPPALKRLKRTLQQIDLDGEFVFYSGPIPHGELHARYADAGVCLFASSCENMPNILLEGMASGLPIACSNRGPMPEVLGGSGVLFDPENPQDIARALGGLIATQDLRSRKAQASFEKVQAYSWERCAIETFDFLAEIGRQQHKPSM